MADQIQHEGVDLHLTAEEAELLLSLLQWREREIQPEIHHARTPEFKDGLRRRRELLRGLVRKFSALSVC